MPASLLIQDVNLLSTGCDGWYRNTSVLIRNGLIEEINPDETGLKADVTPVAGQGGYLLPGLIEMHGHFYGRANIDMRSQHAGYCPLFLAGGVTTVRTPGEFEPDLTYAWKHTNESGQTIGPRIMTGGWYFDRSPSIIKWFQPSASLDEVRACFDERDRVSDFFKVYSSMPTEWIGEVCRLGHARGKKVYGHLGMSTTVGAIEVGLDGIEHGFFTIQEFHSKPSPMIDMDGLDDLDMGADIVRRVQDVILGHGTAVTPTLLTFMLNGPDYTRWLGEMDAWRYLDPGALQKQRELRQTWDSDQKAIDQQERLIEKQRRFVGDLYRQGARIFCGTDPSYPMILPGKGLVREAANLVDCGLPETAVLRALTIGAARELGIDSITGSVEKGKQADLVLLDQDPLANINHLDTTRLVWKGGEMYRPDDLREMAVGKIH